MPFNTKNHFISRLLVEGLSVFIASHIVSDPLARCFMFGQAGSGHPAKAGLAQTKTWELHRST